MSNNNDSSLHKQSIEDIRNYLIDLKMSLKWWEQNKHQYTRDDWWYFNKDESYMTLEEVLALCDRIAIESRQTLADEVGKMLEIQGVNGTWNYDPYMHGIYNGMEFCHALIKGVEPKYREAPKEWLTDKKIDPKLGGGTQDLNPPTNKPKERAKEKITNLITNKVNEARQEPVGAALEIKVPKKTMQFVMAKIKMTDKTISKRVLEPQWRVERWRNGKADQYDLEVEQWKLRILASLTKRYNWAIFLLKPENLPKSKQRNHLREGGE